MNSSIGGAAPETASAGKTEAYVKDQMHDLTRGLRDKLRRRLHAISDRLEEMKERQDNVVQSRSERFRSHFDIVGSLPLEIVLQIVTCLDPEDIARSRRVRMPFFFFFSFLLNGHRQEVILGLTTMALYVLVRYYHQVSFAPNPYLPEHRRRG